MVKNGQLESIEIYDLQLKLLEKYLNKEGINFAIKHDKIINEKVIFFQAKDSTAFNYGFRKTLEKIERVKENPKESVVEKLNNAIDKVKQQVTDKIKNKQHEQSL